MWSVPPVTRSAGVRFVIGQSSYTVGDNAFSMDAVPFGSDGRTLVPVRFLADAPDAHTAWDETTQTLSVTKCPAIYVGMIIVSNTVNTNGLLNQMDVAPVIVNGRTYLPTWYIAEALGYTVLWDAITDTVSINDAR